jgi:hypothetical protein
MEGDNFDIEKISVTAYQDICPHSAIGAANFFMNHTPTLKLAIEDATPKPTFETI